MSIPAPVVTLSGPCAISGALLVNFILSGGRKSFYLSLKLVAPAKRANVLDPSPYSLEILSRLLHGSDSEKSNTWVLMHFRSYYAA